MKRPDTESTWDEQLEVYYSRYGQGLGVATYWGFQALTSKVVYT